MKTRSAVRIVAVALALLAVMESALAQAPPIEKTFGGANRDLGLAIEATNDGGYIIAGTNESFYPGKHHYLLKVDALGDKIWEKGFGGASDWDYTNDVIQTSDGGFATFGATKLFGSSRGKFYLTKTDAAGTTEWEASYGHGDLTGGATFQQTDDDGFILVGVSTQTDAWTDVRMTKVDANGVEQWTRFFAGSYEDGAGDVRVTPDGKYSVYPSPEKSTGKRIAEAPIQGVNP